MECHLCGHHKVNKWGKTNKGSQIYYCPVCQATFTNNPEEDFETDRELLPEQIDRAPASNYLPDWLLSWGKQLLAKSQDRVRPLLVKMRNVAKDLIGRQSDRPAQEFKQLELIERFDLLRLSAKDTLKSLFWWQSDRPGKRPSLGNPFKHTSRYLPLIVVLATAIRIVLLAIVPNGFFCDEAIEGYDAYSVSETLRDQHGEFLPRFFKGFGNDYREPLYAYTIALAIKIFGLNEFSTRLPAAVIGILTVIVLYYLAKELFDERTALFSALFLAISPWHIQFSRIGFRAILLPFVFCLGLLFFVKSFKKPNYLIPSGLIFGLSLYTYSSARGFVPLYLLVLAACFWKHLWRNKKQLIVGSVLFSLIFIPLVFFWISPEGTARLNDVGGLSTNPKEILSNYFSYFSLQFLFIGGDPNLRHSPPDLGELNLFELITVIGGILCLLRNSGRARIILFLWLLLYPIPAALTEPTHAVRSIMGSTLFPILSAYGVSEGAKLYKSSQKQYFFILTIILAASLSVFANHYFIAYPINSAGWWQYGMREAITYAEQSNYKCVKVSNQFRQAYIYVLFYTQHSPTAFQNSSFRPSTDSDRSTGTIGKYEIAPIGNSTPATDKCLFVIIPNEVEAIKAKGLPWREVKTIKDPSGNEAIKLVEVG